MKLCAFISFDSCSQVHISPARASSCASFLIWIDRMLLYNALMRAASVCWSRCHLQRGPSRVLMHTLFKPSSAYSRSETALHFPASPRTLSILASCQAGRQMQDLRVSSKGKCLMRAEVQLRMIICQHALTHAHDVLPRTRRIQGLHDLLLSTEGTPCIDEPAHKDHQDCRGLPCVDRFAQSLLLGPHSATGPH